jgi:succinoglycan biosynthesis transport protein ExoP
MNGSTPDEINLMDYIQVIKKRKWLIITGTLICMCAAGVVSFLMPKIYEAKVYLMVTTPKYQVEFVGKEGSKFSTPLFENISAETFSKMIMNEHTAKTVLTKLGLNNPVHEYTITKILKQVKIEYPRNTNLILLKVQDTSKERAAQIANEWASAFIERNEEVVSKETRNTYDFVIGQLENAKMSLKTSEEELERFQKANKIELLKEQISGKIKQIVQYETKLDDSNRSLMVEKARYQELTAQIKEQGRTLPVDKGLIGKEEINPTYVGLSSRTADTAVNIQSFNAEILQLKENIKNLNEEVSGLKKQLAEQELTQTRLTRNVDTARNTYEILSKKGEETRISSAIKATTIQVSVPAEPPESPIKPKKGLNVMIAGVVGLLASMMVAFFVEYLEKNKSDLEKPV